MNDFFGSGVLAVFSETLEPVRSEPYIIVHPQTAKAYRVADGDKVLLSSGQGNFEVRVKTVPDMSEGTVFLPHLRNTAVGIFVPGGNPIPCTLEKLE